MRIEAQCPDVGEIRIGERIEFRGDAQLAVAADRYAVGGALVELGEIRSDANNAYVRRARRWHRAAIATRHARYVRRFISGEVSFDAGLHFTVIVSDVLARNHLMHVDRPFADRGLPQQPSVSEILALVEHVDRRGGDVGHFLVFDEHGRRGLEKRGVETVVVALAIDQLNQLLEAGELPLRAGREGLHVAVQEFGVADRPAQACRARPAPESSREFPG